MKAVDIKWDIDYIEYEGEEIALPTDIEIPDGIVDEDEISNYLSDVTGFCHEGYVLED